MELGSLRPKRTGDPHGRFCLLWDHFRQLVQILPFTLMLFGSDLRIGRENLDAHRCSNLL